MKGFKESELKKLISAVKENDNRGKGRRKSRRKSRD